MNCMKVWLISGVSFFITIQASEARIKALQMQQPGGTQPQPVDGFEIDIQGNDPGGKMNSTGPYALLITQNNNMRSLPVVAPETQKSDQ